MKKLIFSFSALALLLASCSEEEEANTTPKPIVVGEITGDITTNKVFEKGTYTIKGTVRVKSGSTLTIAAGSSITADVADGLDLIS